jgi:hypothetical protein
MARSSALRPEPRRRGGGAEAAIGASGWKSAFGAAGPIPMTARPAGTGPALARRQQRLRRRGRRMADDSVDLVVTSIPFGNHYEYSRELQRFRPYRRSRPLLRQMDFLTPELLRILKPGRVACVHVKDRIQFASVTGMTRPTVEPFHCRHDRAFPAPRLRLCMGLRFISTDVVRENNQTYRLTYKELKKDSTKMGAGSPEFLLLFFKLPTDRSNGYADEPVTKDPADIQPRALADRCRCAVAIVGRPAADRGDLAGMRPEVLAQDAAGLVRAGRLRSREPCRDRRGAGGARRAAQDLLGAEAGKLPADVDTDVARMLTLNSEQQRRRVEQHICPLQFDIVDRAIRLYSNPASWCSIRSWGSAPCPMRAIKLGRRGAGVELDPKSFATPSTTCARRRRSGRCRACST